MTTTKQEVNERTWRMLEPDLDYLEVDQKKAVYFVLHCRLYLLKPMSIINSTRFKRRLRVVTEASHPQSSSHMQLPHGHHWQRVNLNLAGQGRSSLHRHLNQSIMQQTEQSELSQPNTSEKLYLDSYQHQARIITLDDEKQRKMPKRCLRLELPKQGVSASEISRPRRIALSKQSHASSDSIKLYKIRSIVTIDPHKDTLSRNSLNHKPHSRYEEHDRGLGKSGSREKKGRRTIVVERERMEGGRRSGDGGLTVRAKDRIDNIEGGFLVLAEKMRQLGQEQLVNRKGGEGRVLKQRNKQAATRICLRTLKNKLRAYLSDLLDY